MSLLEKRKTTTLIVLHHSDSDRHTTTIEGITKFHMDPPPQGRGWLACGYHKFIDGSGKVVNTNRPEDTIGAHCEGHNYCSIGICVAGTFMAGKDVMVPDTKKDAQYASLIQTLAVECKKYGLNETAIQGHKDWYPTSCPGTLYDLLPQVRRDVARYL